jgi:hypothetical protein
MMPDLMLAEMSEPFEIFLDYEMPTTSSVQLADAKELAEMIKTASWPSMLLRESVKKSGVGRFEVVWRDG